MLYPVAGQFPMFGLMDVEFVGNGLQLKSTQTSFCIPPKQKYKFISHLVEVLFAQQKKIKTPANVWLQKLLFSFPFLSCRNGTQLIMGHVYNERKRPWWCWVALFQLFGVKEAMASPSCLLVVTAVSFSVAASAALSWRCCFWKVNFANVDHSHDHVLNFVP